MIKDVEIVLSKEAEEVYDYLLEEAKHSKVEASILRAIRDKSNMIKLDVTYGNSIRKKEFPKKYVERYSITNLYRVELPNFWRMFYTLSQGEEQVKVIAFVLDIIDHKKYNKIIKFKK